ncbi:uncharacterized protein [Blastocystis hominis]|uniref:U4/U6.U5 small nuclear ribonucleoprotein 27kDa protein domain-containing protein n=1 Tax=Blastocystis hominis TaxID=12968 RepID=D8MBH3_BLAHO|nr:uncharacterized protein [Blastocystis hominis]CBK25412.2 unnamed protein product [Blastocystis hominis]|eukprot:XP_012899460.1 uncharacterized protein [Blastocystis hominis]
MRLNGRSRSRSRSRSSSCRHRSRSSSYESDRHRGHSSRRSEQRRDRIVLDEFGREVKLSDLRKQRQERQERNDSREKPDDKEKNSLDIKIKINNIEKQTPEEVDPVVPASRPPDDYELEEGEDFTATMQQLMGFSSFSSTKGKHVRDNDSLVNRGACRVIKQFRPMRILNRKGK